MNDFLKDGIATADLCVPLLQKSLIWHSFNLGFKSRGRTDRLGEVMSCYVKPSKSATKVRLG